MRERLLGFAKMNARGEKFAGMMNAAGIQDWPEADTPEKIEAARAYMKEHMEA